MAERKGFEPYVASLVAAGIPQPGWTEYVLVYTGNLRIAASSGSASVAKRSI